MRTRLAALLLPLWIGLLSIGAMAGLARLAPAPTHDCLPERVTRCAHDRGEPEASDRPLARLAIALIGVAKTVGQSVPGAYSFGTYQVVNLAVYVALWPLLMAALTAWAVWPLDRRTRERPASVSTAGLLGIGTWTDPGAFGQGVYWACTDFVVTLANLADTSYLEMNGVLFGIVWPVYTLAMLGIGVARRVRARRGR